jgi:hypothetical protein
MSTAAGASGSSSIAAQAANLRTSWSQSHEPSSSRYDGDVSDTSSETSSDVSDSSYDSEEEEAMIKEEWDESVRQMKMLFSIVLMPFFGKWMGRRWSYWGES